MASIAELLSSSDNNHNRNALKVFAGSNIAARPTPLKLVNGNGNGHHPAPEAPPVFGLKTLKNNSADFPVRHEDVRNDIVSYFVNLDTKFKSADTFCLRWASVSNLEKPEELVDVLSQSSLHLRKRKNDIFPLETISFCREFMAHNFAFWSAKALPLVKDMKAHQLTQIMNGFTDLGIHPGQNFLQAWTDRSIEIMPSFAASHLKENMRALSCLGINPGTVYKQAWSEAFQHISFNLDHGVQIAWALAIQDMMEKNDGLAEEAKNILRKLYYRSEPKTEAALQQLADASLWFGFPSKNVKPTSNRTSVTERKIAEVFYEQGIDTMKSPKLVPFLGHPPDIQLLPLNRNSPHDLYIEVDGPMHFVRNAETLQVSYNGPSLLQAALKNKIGGAVHIHLPYLFAEAVLDMDPAKQSAVIADLYRQMNDLRPGIYRVPADYQSYDLESDKAWLAPSPF